jgi:hypothetical protein
MSNTYITQSFKLNSSLQFLESFNEPANNMYFMFAGRHLPWDNDARPPLPNESTKGLVTDIWDNMMYGKNITPNDVVPVTRRIDWVSNTVYTAYTDDVPNLFDTNFYVVAQDGTTYKVFKCLDNNSGSRSTIKPTTAVASDIDYMTSDGYRWKWMYTITEDQWNKFATAAFVPVIPNANVTANAVSGSIDVIKVTNGGANYNSYHDGSFQAVSIGGDSTRYQIDVTAASNADFYINNAIQVMSGAGAGQVRRILDYTVTGQTKIVVVDSPFNPVPAASDLYEISPLVRIVGDGEGATARAIVNPATNSISRVLVVNRGTGYTWANAIITANTGFIGNTTPQPANVVVIMPPVGGHGANAYSELGVKGVTVAVSFNSADSSNNIVDQNDIRTFGIIQDPLFSNVVVNISGIIGSYTAGERVIQANTNASGFVSTANSTVLGLTSVRGYFNSGFVITGQTSNATATAGMITGPTTYFDQTYNVTVDIEDGVYALDEIVTQGSHMSARVSSVTQISGATYRVQLTNVRGIINLTDDATDVEQTLVGFDSDVEGSVTAVKKGDLVRPTGSVIFVDNVAPIAKVNNQTETVRLTLEF